MSTEGYTPPEAVAEMEKIEAKEKMKEIIAGNIGSWDTIVDARKLGFEEKEVREFAQRMFEERLRTGATISLIFRMAESTKVMTEEEVKTFVRPICEDMLANKPTDWEVADYLFGKDSKEFKTSLKLWKEKEKAKKDAEKKQRKGRWSIVRDGENIRISLANDATIAELFEAMESDEDLEEMFRSEANGNLTPETSDALQDAFHDATTNQMKVVDFFKAQKVTKGAIETFLPITFKK